MTSRSRLANFDETDDFTGPGGAVRISTDRLPANGVSLTVERFGPSGGLRRHYHEAPGEEHHLVVWGVGTVWLGEDDLGEAGQPLYVPPEVVQGLRTRDARLSLS